MMFSNTLLSTTLLVYSTAAQQYLPTWESLDTRPLPKWWSDAKIGIFIHWGVFSVPSFHSEWFWEDLSLGAPDVVAFVNSTEAPGFTYPEYGNRFDATFFNATQWLELFKSSGAKYIVPTTKHHEGFCNWPSATSWNWNSQDIGPHRDLIGEIANATVAAGLHFGLYHSLFEWFNPLYLQDKANNWTTRTFAQQKTFPELYDLVLKYNPEVIWSDGEWEADNNYWNSTGFLAWLANESPVKDTVLWNDRWAAGTDNTLCHHGSYYTCADRFLPNSLVGHPWENAFTIDSQSWGYRRNALLSDYMTTSQVISTVVQTVALGGNALINIGPAHDGSIDPIFADRLTGLGTWLTTNGEAIYATQPWSIAQNESTTVWYTSNPSLGSVYAIVLEWPVTGILSLSFPTATIGITNVTMLGMSSSTLQWTPLSNPGEPGIKVTLPSLLPGSSLSSTSAWSLKFLGLK
jgi:alpha-L-fucosidase